MVPCGSAWGSGFDFSRPEVGSVTCSGVSCRGGCCPLVESDLDESCGLQRFSFQVDMSFPVFVVAGLYSFGPVGAPSAALLWCLGFLVFLVLLVEVTVWRHSLTGLLECSPRRASG